MPYRTHNRMGIQKQLLFLLFLTITSFGTLFYFSWWAKEFNQKVREETVFNERLTSGLLQLRRAEKDYFARQSQGSGAAHKYKTKHDQISEKKSS